MPPLFIFVFLTLGLISSMVAGLLIYLGIKIIVDPNFYHKMNSLIQEDDNTLKDQGKF